MMFLKNWPYQNKKLAASIFYFVQKTRFSEQNKKLKFHVFVYCYSEM